MYKESKQPAKRRVILHIDMNAFYCSVHEATEPDKYKGKPIAVAGSVEMRKGIVVTSSYAARQKGVRTGMQVWQAKKCCPELVLISPDFKLYRRFSDQFIQIVKNYTPQVEVASIDECYADISGSGQFGTPVEIAAKIQTRIRDELLLPCSIGIAPNKLLAKMASDMKKPNGLSILRIRDVPHVLWDKPCAELFGIGERTAEKLKTLQIRTIGQLAEADEAMLNRVFGVYGSWMKQAANGRDTVPVNPLREQNKSIGHTTTLSRNFTDFADIKRIFLNLADQVGRELRRQQLLAATIQITIRDPAMKTITRSITLPFLTENMDDIYRESCRLFQANWPEGEPVRLLGIALSNLREKKDTAQQLDLFDYEKQPKKEQLNKAMDQLRDKYGEDAILSAGMVLDAVAKVKDPNAKGKPLQKPY